MYLYHSQKSEEVDWNFKINTEEWSKQSGEKIGQIDEAFQSCF